MTTNTTNETRKNFLAAFEILDKIEHSMYEFTNGEQMLVSSRSLCSVNRQLESLRAALTQAYANI